jgi:thioredoxin 1
MALRIPTIASSHGLASSPAPISTTCRPAVLAVGSSWASAAQKRSLLLATTASETRGVAPVRSSGIETTISVGAAEAVTGQVTEVNKDTFWPIVEAAGDKVVVLDMYTEWYLQFFYYYKNQNLRRL